MAFLQILSGKMNGRKFEIDRDKIIVGRSHDNVVSIDALSVSSEHCAILREGRKYTLRDLNSTNGTYLNDVKITEYRLSPKDVIKVGDIEIKFDGNDVVPPSSRSGPPTDTAVTIKKPSVSSAQPIGVSSPFRTRRNTKFIWIVTIIMIGIFGIAASAWLIYFIIHQK